MMCSRADWGLFVSMFGCLWQSVYDDEVGNGKAKRSKDNTDFDRLLAEIQSEQFTRAVVQYWEKWGFAPHPSTALSESRELSVAP